ncbi:MAG: hypothetical protein IPO21_02805 [Bacteroidales bacterium]|nr:hypothetical protein [Bacteroidales bacterium]
MKTIKFLAFPLLLSLCLIFIVPFQSCKDDDDCDDCTTVKKPNIYIYPSEQIDLTVKLNFPMGGKVVASIPDYGKGWNITVDTSGMINNTYSFLFYESKQPDIWQRSYGWNVQTDKLESFFRQNMTDYGFKGREIEDFIEYWIPRLNDYTSYSIYPQTQSLIEEVIQLDFSKQPENILRLFYVVEGSNQLKDNLTIPTIDSFKREGYFATEWGVINDL